MAEMDRQSSRPMSIAALGVDGGAAKMQNDINASEDSASRNVFELSYLGKVPRCAQSAFAGYDQ